MEDFFSEKDKNSMAFAACVASQTVIGGAVASIGSLGIAAPIGFGAGLLFGVLTCPKLKAPIKRKLFGSDSSYEEQEVSQMIEVMKSLRPGVSNQEALSIIANANNIIASDPEKFKVI
jgi:hypothetical protein